MRRFVFLPILVLMLLAPAAAHADGGAAVIRDCLNHGSITGHYTQQQYAQALAELPADVAEYSDCGSLIRQAQLAAASSRGGVAPAAATNSPSTATPAERAALRAAQRTGSQPLDIGGHMVRPGVIRTSSVFNTLPTPLLIALAVLIAGTLGVGGRRVWSIVRARR
jgi:hypothetical protein